MSLPIIPLVIQDYEIYALYIFFDSRLKISKGLIMLNMKSATWWLSG